MYRLGIHRNDPTLDLLERLLVLTSITELPQLVNVLIGEMSLVGPRPELPERVKAYSEWQRQRLNVTPGMTGLAQVHGLRDPDSSDAKSNYDLEYILHWSAGGDLSLIVQTAWTLILRLKELRHHAISSEPRYLSPPEPSVALSTRHASSAFVTEKPRSMAHADRS
jgi:lipopolysaccharide/colanic/teichoic acid biosynthesis glycosyltransferase